MYTARSQQISLNVPKDLDAFVPGARDGTLRVLKAASRNGIKRVVATSTLGAVTYGEHIEPERVYTDKDWTDPDYKGINAYIRAKTLAEKSAWEFMESCDSEMTLAVVNPGLILGPLLIPKIQGYPVRESNKCLLESFQCTHVLDFLLSMFEMLPLVRYWQWKRGGCRRAIFMCGDFAWFSDLGAILREQYPDRKIPSLNMPNWLVHLFGLFNGGVRQLRDDLNRTQHVEY